jgi:hypothetical protein
MTPLRVLLVSTWETACGIAEHSFYLKQAIEAVDPTIEITPCPAALDPSARNTYPFYHFDVLHLNYQAALHSRWTPDVIKGARTGGEYKAVIVTYHDTGVPNSDQCKAVIDAADAAVVHEPFDDLPPEKTHYWRMGVPDWEPAMAYNWSLASWCGPRPILGTVGFPFPWKCIDQLAEVTAAAGWAFLVIAPGATADQIAGWRQCNPHLDVLTAFTPRELVVSQLAGCDATAFTYVCHNTGQSGAILQGIAARKPVIALSTCRQFRALFEDGLGYDAIDWCITFDEVCLALVNMPIVRVSAPIVALAEQESWSRLGQKYSKLYREIAG